MREFGNDLMSRLVIRYILSVPSRNNQLPGANCFSLINSSKTSIATEKAG